MPTVTRRFRQGKRIFFHCFTKGMPTAIIAHTVKGKGVSFMENQVGWHGTAPNKEQYEQATAELQAEIDRLEGNC